MAAHTSPSTLPNHSRPSLTAQDTTFHREMPESNRELFDTAHSNLAEVTRANIDTWDFTMSPPAMNNCFLYSDEHTIPEGGHPHTAHLSLVNEPWFSPRGTLATPIGSEQRMQHDYGPQCQSDTSIALESVPTLPHPIALNDTHGDNMSSGSHKTYDPSPDGTYLGNHATWCDPRQMLWPDLSVGQQLFPLAETIGHCPFDESSAHKPFSSTCHVVHAHHSSTPEVAGSSIPFDIPLPQLANPSLSYLVPHPYPSPDRYVRIVQEFCTPSPSHRRGTRAIEYGEMWLDEEELRKALIETGGKLTVFQCLWEQDHSPCHVWIKGDKSYINAHIKKWHGGKPGGEKLEVDCHWSSCGKRMRKESITRHILSVHLGELWECRGCGKEIARSDALRRHVANSDSELCRTLDALITYSADARAIDVSAALTSGGRLRYAGA